MPESGGQPGNKNAVKGKRWSTAINAALDKRCKSDGIKALNDLAEKLLEKCDEGDMTALKELGDRLDGKPHQDLNVTGDFNITVPTNDAGTL